MAFYLQFKKKRKNSVQPKTAQQPTLTFIHICQSKRRSVDLIDSTLAFVQQPQEQEPGRWVEAEEIHGGGGGGQINLHPHS